MNSSQLLNCEYLLVVLLFYDSKFNIFKFGTLGQTKQVIRRRHFGLMGHFSQFSVIL